MEKQYSNGFLTVFIVFILTTILIFLFPSSIGSEAGIVSPTPSNTSMFINVDADSSPETAKPSKSPSSSESASTSPSETTPTSTNTITTSAPTSTSTAVPSPWILDLLGIPDGIDIKKPVIALTFDDGPTVAVTNRILDTLEQCNAKATFFIVGNRINSEKARYTIARIDSLGCEIGNHTYNHSRLAKLNADAIQNQISSTNTLVNSIISKSPRLVRPTYGEYSDLVRVNVDAPLMLWSIDTQDWLTRNAEAITKHVLDKVKDGDVILMHDLYAATADAVDMLVPQLIEKGYQLVTVSELYEIKNVQLKTQTVYSRPK